MFCLVVDMGSVSQAANLSFVSQPAVTKQIQHLENTYGALLFERKDGRLSLTKNGEILYPYARSIVDEYNRSQESIQERLDDANTRLTVGASYTIGEYLLPSLMGKFKKKHPKLKLSLSINNTPQIIDELVLIHPPDHSWNNREEITIEEITHERMLWRETTSGTRLIIEKILKDHNVLDKIDNDMVLGTTQAIKSAVAAGLGVSIVSRLT